jgi:hypothetical protein
MADARWLTSRVGLLGRGGGSAGCLAAARAPPPPRRLGLLLLLRLAAARRSRRWASAPAACRVARLACRAALACASQQAPHGRAAGRPGGPLLTVAPPRRWLDNSGMSSPECSKKSPVPVLSSPHAGCAPFCVRLCPPGPGTPNNKKSGAEQGGGPWAGGGSGAGGGQGRGNGQRGAGGGGRGALGWGRRRAMGMGGRGLAARRAGARGGVGRTGGGGGVGAIEGAIAIQGTPASRSLPRPTPGRPLRMERWPGVPQTSCCTSIVSPLQSRRRCGPLPVADALGNGDSEL